MPELVTANEIMFTPFEPKLKNRFIMVIDGIPAYMIKGAQRPQLQFADFYKKNVTFNVLGPVGDKVEEWTLKGAYIQQANFGDLDFGENAPLEITMTLRYDYAILQF